MAMHTYEGIVMDLKATLIDGYLPDRDFLLKTAEEVAKEVKAQPERKYSLQKRPFTWDSYDKDALFEYIAFNTRGQYCMNRPKNHHYSDAWLLKPQKWKKGYTLKDAKKDHSDRRLLVTLYTGCNYGDQCLENLVKCTGLAAIADEEYKSISAFKEDAEHLLDSISLPFRSPHIIAGDKMTAHGYEFRTFGR